MLSCKNCGDHFPNRVKIDNKEYTLHHRSYCLKCNPLGERRFWGGKKVDPDRKKKQKKREFICKICGKFSSAKSRNKDCTTCRSKKFRTAKKTKAVEYLGNKCKICEYDKCLAALVFHHIDPKEKDFNLSSHWDKPWDFLENELTKCVLLCSNCHAEVHSGITVVSS